MSSATPGGPASPAHPRQPKSVPPTDDWELDFACIPSEAVRFAKFMAFMHGSADRSRQIFEDLNQGLDSPTPTFQNLCLPLMRLQNEEHHLLGIWATEDRVRGDKLGRDLETIRAHTTFPTDLLCYLGNSQPLPPHLPSLRFRKPGDRQSFHPRLLHLRNLGHLDHEIQEWLYDQFRDWNPRFRNSSLPGGGRDASKFIAIQKHIQGMLHNHSKSQVIISKSKAGGVPEELLSGHWGGTGELEPSQSIIDVSCLPQVLKTCRTDGTIQHCIQRWNYLDPDEERFGDFGTDPQVGELQNSQPTDGMGKIVAACNSYVVELTSVVLTREDDRESDSLLPEPRSPYLFSWTQTFLDWTKKSLSRRTRAMADAILALQAFPLEGETRAASPKLKTIGEAQYFFHRHQLEQLVGGTGFRQNSADQYFSFSYTIPAMLGVLAELLDLSFDKVSTLGTLVPEGTLVYDLSEPAREGGQEKYLGRLYLELARRDTACRWWHPNGPEADWAWSGKTFEYPEVEILQSPYDDPDAPDRRVPGSIHLKTRWSYKVQVSHLTLEQVQRLFQGIGQALHILLIKGNRVTLKGKDGGIPVEIQSMVGTVFARLARHPAVLRRITRHYQSTMDVNANGQAHSWSLPSPQNLKPASSSEVMPEEMIRGIVDSTKFEILRSTLDSLAGAMFDQKVRTIPSVEEAKKFHVAREWNETVKEILLVEPNPEFADYNHGFKTEAFYTFTKYRVPGHSYFAGEALGLDMFTSKLAAGGLFDNKREWARFRDIVLSINPNTEPIGDYSKWIHTGSSYNGMIQEYLRRINLDIFLECTEGLEERFKEILVEYEATVKELTLKPTFTTLPLGLQHYIENHSLAIRAAANRAAKARDCSISEMSDDDEIWHAGRERRGGRGCSGGLQFGRRKRETAAFLGCQTTMNSGLEGGDEEIAAGENEASEEAEKSASEAEFEMVEKEGSVAV